MPSQFPDSDLLHCTTYTRITTRQSSFLAHDDLSHAPTKPCKTLSSDRLVDKLLLQAFSRKMNHLLQELPYNDLPHKVNQHILTAATGDLSIFRFYDLPTELQTAILACLLRPSDLAKVCLVSRWCHVLAVPLLYNTVYLNFDRWCTDHLRNFLRPRHPGHKHIRALDVDSTKLESEKDALKLAKDILQLLPRNQLHCFRFVVIS